MYVRFPPDSRTTRVYDERIGELNDGEPVDREGPDDDRYLQVEAELGDHLVDRYEFETNTDVDEGDVVDDEQDDEDPDGGGDA